jgi:hypothetical protein
VLGYLRPGADPEALYATYGQRTDLKNFRVHPRGFFFVKEISPEALASLRCEPDVKSIEYNAVIRITDI